MEDLDSRFKQNYTKSVALLETEFSYWGNSFLQK